MRLETSSFGTLEYQAAEIIHIQEGMLGFSRCKQYILIEDEDIHPFKWLQSVEDPYVAFPVVDPRIIMANYRCAITQEDMQSLEFQTQDELIPLSVVVIREDPALSTINLKAPLLINYRRMIGKQVILSDSGYDTMQPLIFSPSQVVTPPNESLSARRSVE